MIWFSQSLLSAHAITANGDSDLPDSLHVRLVPHNEMGLPLTPFLIYPIEIQPVRAHGELIDNGDGTKRVFVPDIPASEGVIVAAEARSQDHRHSWLAAMHVDGLRIAVKRSQFPYQIAAPRLNQLRVSHSVDEVSFFSVRPTDLEKQIFGKLQYSPLGLPIGAELPWYAGGGGRDAGVKRVLAGAPKRATPVDQPDGMREQRSPDDEWARLAHQAGELDGMLEAILGQGEKIPSGIQLSQNGLDENGVLQSVSSQLLSDVMLRSIDPGMARYMGFAAALDRFGTNLPHAREMSAIGAVALFALPRRVVQQLSRFGAGPKNDQMSPALIEVFVKHFPGVEKTIELARKFDLWIGAISTVAAAAPQPDTPEIPGVHAQLGRWRANEGGGSFAQGFVFRRPPLAPLVAVARDEGGWVSRHAIGEAGRRAIRLLGSRRDPSPSNAEAAEIQGIVYDDPISGRAPPRYRFALGDLFGRYGAPAECHAVSPPRPDPPKPVVQTFVHRSTSLPSAGAFLPGKLELRVPIPSLDDLALGSLAIVAIRITFGGMVHEQFASDSLFQSSYDFPPLQPMQSKLFDLAVRFVDSDGVESEPFSQELQIGDARAPAPIPFGYGLIWTSRPGPAQNVQLALDWPAPIGQQHRVYVADAAGLGLSGTSRAQIADTGVKRALAGEISGSAIRKCFRLLTDEPIVPDGDGVVRFRATLPRALQTVQFVRVVPISAVGVEADFDACGIVPVAVPADRRPPPPRLRLLPAAGGDLPELRIEATGLNLTILERGEPGLFTGGDSAHDVPPEYRLRRASGAIPDPIYAREIVRGFLARHGIGHETIFTKSLRDPADPLPYGRYTYWAEIRMPPERRLLAPEMPISGGVSGPSAAQMVHCPGVWSAVSAPLTLVHAPAGKPIALATADLDARFIVADHRIELTVRNAPLPTPGGQWKLRIWLGTDQGALRQVMPDTPISSGLIQWKAMVSATTVKVDLVAALVDPLGRESSLTQIFIASI